MKNLKRIAFAVLMVTGSGIMLSSCGSGTEHVSDNEPIALKLNFKEGDKYLYSTQVDQKIESIATMNMKTTMDMIYTCGGDSAGNKKISITYDRIAMDMASPMGQMNYDSRKPENTEAGMPSMGSIVGKTFSMWVSPEGSIQKIEGLGEVLNSVSQSGRGAKPGMDNPLTDSTIRAMMQNSFDIYPGKKVKIGDTWTKKTQLGISGANLNVENTYTLKSVEGGKATLALASVMTLPQSGMGPEGAGMQMEMNGTQEGTIDIDIATGQMLSGKIKQDIKGTMTIEGMGQPMPMNIHGDITTTSKKL